MFSHLLIRKFQGSGKMADFDTDSNFFLMQYTHITKLFRHFDKSHRVHLTHFLICLLMPWLWPSVKLFSLFLLSNYFINIVESSKKSFFQTTFFPWMKFYQIVRQLVVSGWTVVCFHGLNCTQICSNRNFDYLVTFSDYLSTVSKA